MDVIKLNNHDSVILKGLFSSKGKLPKTYFFSRILLTKAKIIDKIGQDEKWMKQLTSKYDCTKCTTDIKKYHKYIIEDVLNCVRVEKDFFNLQLSFKLVITEFYKSGISNYIKEGGIGGYVTDGDLRYKIVIYGIRKKDCLMLNSGDTINVKGNLIQTSLGRADQNEFISHDLITLNNCVLLK
jgi:hypothetical protein